jgi:hypothetical protein
MFNVSPCNCVSAKPTAAANAGGKSVHIDSKLPQFLVKVSVVLQLCQCICRLKADVRV